MRGDLAHRLRAQHAVEALVVEQRPHLRPSAELLLECGGREGPGRGAVPGAALLGVDVEADHDAGNTVGRGLLPVPAAPIVVEPERIDDRRQADELLRGYVARDVV